MSDITLAQLETSEIYFKLPKIFFEQRAKNYGKDNNLESITVITSDYVDLSNDAKLAYGVLYDRLQASLNSAKNGNLHWVDKNGAVFLEYSVADLAFYLNRSIRKVVEIKKELKSRDLLREVRRGNNKTNLLYLQNIDPERKCKKVISGGAEFALPEVQESKSSKNSLVIDDDDINKAEFQKIWKVFKARFVDERNYSDSEMTDMMLSLEQLFNQHGAALLDECVKRVVAQDIPEGSVTKPLNYVQGIFRNWDKAGIKSIEDVWLKDPYVAGEHEKDSTPKTFSGEEFSIPTQGY